MSKRWVIPPSIDEIISQRLQAYPPYLRQVLFNRGITTIEAADQYLNATNPLADPFLLTDMDKAVDRLLSAAKSGESIVVYGDYDVDGVTATSMMVEVLRSFNANVTPYIPNRFEEGYGLNLEAIQYLHGFGAKVILTVDCGIRSPREADYARELGVDLIISDHHHPEDDLPRAFAVICPKREGDPYPDKELAGVGVGFKIVEGLFLREGKNRQNANEWLDLVALGTVADVVPLTGENRVMVRKGIRLIRTGKRIGLNALAGVAGKDIRETTATDIGFILGPRLNAAGRMESALQSFDLLVADDRGKAGVIAQKLDDQNTERQKATRKAVEKALAGVGDLSGKYLISAFDAEFSSGIVGLVASKLVEGNYRPACVGHIEGDFIRASCRSISEFHITDALDECADLLERHGGHAMAAGFTVRYENVDALVERLEQIAARELSETVDLRPVLRADLEISIEEVRPEMYAELANLQPIGMNNPGAVFIARGVSLDRVQLMGKDKTHLSFAPRNCAIARAVAFNQADWYELWRKENTAFDLVFTIDVNHYYDQATLQLQIRDMRPSGSGDA